MGDAGADAGADTPGFAGAAGAAGATGADAAAGAIVPADAPDGAAVRFGGCSVGCGCACGGVVDG